MSKMEFIYNGEKITIQCTHEDKVKDIISKYFNKLKKDINKLYFLYNGERIDGEKTFIEQSNREDKKNNKMIVLVYDKDISDISGEETKKNSNYVICPICH